MADTVLFVNHRTRRCGVHEFGLEICAQISSSQHFNFVYVECESLDELMRNFDEHRPRAIIFNYHPTTMRWGHLAALAFVGVPTVGVIHDVTSEMADTWKEDFFFRLITHDPHLETSNQLFSRAPRPVPQYRPTSSPPHSDQIRIGSFGFAAPDKGFDQIVLAAQNSFDNCLIRLHIPGGDFYDVAGDSARELVERCRSLVIKPGIMLEAVHDFLSRDQLIEFLASNHLNALFYEPDRGLGGISSAADIALASGRPLALRRGKMFRNFAGANPSIFIDDVTLPEILANGTAPLEPFLSSWTPAALVAAYELVVNKAISEFHTAPPQYRRAAQMSGIMLREYKTKERDLEERLVAMRSQVDSHVAHISELTSNMTAYAQESRRANSRARTAEDVLNNKRPLGRIRQRLRHRRQIVQQFNTLLDDGARAYYESSIRALWRAAPATMQRKIPEANVQQGFMLAAVESLLRKLGSGRILCVGCFEDTACLTLQALGYDVDAIDPDLNFDLAAFKASQPSKVCSYSVVFSTSVIEHVPDDEQFVRDLVEMAAPGGAIVLTCDFRDDWTPDQQKPSSNYRIYTARDMDRLLGAMGQVELIDTPDWLAHYPDFSISEFGTTMHYGFATLAVRRSAQG
jgi:2-polyprenyl-3-methyl-5-hydroxy-6-metoxy-1,4-benzoquinol methylase